MLPLKNIVISILAIVIFLNWGNAAGQLDDRFGSGGVEGTMYLGQQGLTWYRDWQDSYLPGNYPASEKNKIWTVGKIDYRTDGLGMDWRWIILDLLEDTDVDLLQNFLNLCLAIVDSHIIPIIDDYWTINKPLLETALEDTLDNFTFTDKKYGIKYRAKTKHSSISFQDTLPDFNLSVVADTINFKTSLSAEWTTHIYIEAWVLNPNPFNWGYHWKDIGDANCDFQTTINIIGKIGLNGQGRDRYLQIQNITPDSKTESDIDWSLLGISFTWEELSNAVEDLVDKEIEKSITKQLNKEPITTPYYFVDYFKELFSGEIVPTQQEVLDRIFDEEKKYVVKAIERNEYEGEYWTIGYEPNWFLLLEPEQYAEYYIKYYRLIKNLDPNAKVLGPSLFLTEAIENPGEIAFLFIPDIFKGLLAGVKQEFKNLINSYFQNADSKIWYRQFINHLPSDVKVDVNDFHIFPMNADFQIIEWDSLKVLMDEMAAFMRKVSNVEDVWVSEFGNIDWRRSEKEVADMCQSFCQYFKSNTVGIKRWFWFLSRGHSPFYDLPLAPKPPKTALLNNDFTLTPIGKIYLFEADCTSPIMESAPTDGGKYTSLTKVIFHWQQAKEYDTGITDYQILVKSEPGNITVYEAWLGTKLSCLVTGNSGQTLYAKVRAKNGAGLIGDWSEWSDGITVRSGINDSTGYKLTEDLNSEQISNRKALAGKPSDNNKELTANARLSKRNEGLEVTESVSIDVPNSFELYQNYPNPFNATTNINYQLAEDCYVVIKIYNSLGQEIAILVNEYKTAGYYTVQWEGRDFSGNQLVSGIYLYRIHAGNYFNIKKMGILK